MAWTSLNEEASGYYQCLSVYQAGTGVSLDWPPESPDNQYHLNK